MDPPNTKPYHLPPDAVWFITGCSSGIGHALAQLLAQTEGQRVVATARKAAALADIPGGDRVLKLGLDVTSAGSIDAALRAALDRFGRVDILVNNAGYTLAGDTEVAGDEEARALMDTNFWGMVDVSKRVLPIMREENPKTGQQGGVILNVSSMGGYTGYPGQAFYHASKFAMEGWTESVAKEVPSTWNIHLSNIEPGGVKTNYATSSMKRMARSHPAYADPSYPAQQLLRHVGSEQGRAHWAEPAALAAAIYGVVARGRRVPIRVPLGADAWGMIGKDLEATRADLDDIKDISLSVSDAQQMESIRFLHK
ncbi:short-chain dehydrogenase [Xylaria palmicola]|nr:short-chain dehydrogenase [Xylaria palmicola]